MSVAEAGSVAEGGGVGEVWGVELGGRPRWGVALGEGKEGVIWGWDTIARFARCAGWRVW